MQLYRLAGNIKSRAKAIFKKHFRPKPDPLLVTVKNYIHMEQELIEALTQGREIIVDLSMGSMEEKIDIAYYIRGIVQDVVNRQRTKRKKTQTRERIRQRMWVKCGWREGAPLAFKYIMLHGNSQEEVCS